MSSSDRGVPGVDDGSGDERPGGDGGKAAGDGSALTRASAGSAGGGISTALFNVDPSRVALLSALTVGAGADGACFFFLGLSTIGCGLTTNDGLGGFGSFRAMEGKSAEPSSAAAASVGREEAPADDDTSTGRALSTIRGVDVGGVGFDGRSSLVELPVEVPANSADRPLALASLRTSLIFGRGTTEAVVSVAVATTGIDGAVRGEEVEVASTGTPGAPLLPPPPPSFSLILRAIPCQSARTSNEV